MFNFRALIQICGVSSAIIFSNPVFSGQPGQAKLKIHGVIEVIECSVNGADDKEINFGDAVGINKVDGSRYKKPIPFTVSCSNLDGSETPELLLTVSGEATTFDDAAVQTNIDGFGIQIQNGDKPLKLNEAFSFKYDSLPKLSAVPVKQNNVELNAASFNATVRLVVEVA
ncbi:fimbrial protein [Rahnella laticis]|uniref:fimbrial protein n=1 Tax=Rahnella laticis TaxID=2787622 RepID=UPI0018A2571B|nr:fimbrial protein [Rahnella laticis]MBF7997766.1 fimbrial protein [Rahnella laticis]